MVVFKCDACKKVCSVNDTVLIAEFPRRAHTSARDSLGVKLIEFPDMTFAQTHFCKECYGKLLNWTCPVDEEEEVYD